MKINDTLLQENFEKSEYEKIQMLKKIYIKNMSYIKNNNRDRYHSMIRLMTEEERDLMFKGELNDEIIERNQHNGTNNDRSFTREDGVFIKDVWQTTFMIILQKIVTELDTILFFSMLGNRFIFKFNPKATNVDGTQPITSEPDFIMIDRETDETFYIEQKALYFGRTDNIIMKRWQYDRLERYIKEGKEIVLLNKVYDDDFNIELDLYYLNDNTKDKTIWYQYYDKRDYNWVYSHLKPTYTFKEDLCSTKLINQIDNEEIKVNLDEKEDEPIIVAFA